MTTGDMRIPIRSAAAIETVAGFAGISHCAFYLQFWPAAAPRAHMVYLPPFAEEMNRCRAMVAEQARWFARNGISCTLVDFYGTGESPGDLTVTSLAIWRQNITDILALLTQRSPLPVYLWGCRLGALLALDYLAWNPGAAEKLLLWQPMVSGSAFVTQLLRQRTASQMQKGEKPDSTATMKAQLVAGEAFDVAGYRLGGTLLSDIDRTEISGMLAGPEVDAGVEIFWFEHAPDATTQPGARSMRAMAKLRESGAHVTLDTFTGDPVWQLHKRGACNDLLVKTGELPL